MQYFYFVAVGPIFEVSLTKWHCSLWNWIVYNSVVLLLDYWDYFRQCHDTASHLNGIIFVLVISHIFSSISLFLFISHTLLLDKFDCILHVLFDEWDRFGACLPFTCAWIDCLWSRKVITLGIAFVHVLAYAHTQMELFLSLLLPLFLACN